MNYNIEEVLDLCELMAQESPFPFPANRDHWRKTLSSDLVSVIVVNSEQTPVGFILGIIHDSHPIFGDIRYGAELAWYVHQDYRGTGVAKRLLDKFEDWASINDCKFVVVAGIHNSSLPKVKHMYEKSGYKEVEVAFIKELK